ncbi:MAG: hypothetical protein N2V75_09065 [Methanophagales archaeon]|nr:hypothetical protein [Methanophagales archaeon]
MSEIVNQSLQKIAKGTGIIFIGTIIGMLLGFVSSEYGIFSLALVLMSIFALISSLGLQSGVTRQIAFFRGKKANESGIVKFPSLQLLDLLDNHLLFHLDFLDSSIAGIAMLL